MSRARLNNPRYSKKDYEMVASILKAEQNPEEINVDLCIEKLAARFATVFKADSPYLFNEKKFLTACGVQHE